MLVVLALIFGIARPSNRDQILAKARRAKAQKAKLKKLNEKGS